MYLIIIFKNKQDMSTHHSWVWYILSTDWSNGSVKVYDRHSVTFLNEWNIESAARIGRGVIAMWQSPEKK